MATTQLQPMQVGLLGMGTVGTRHVDGAQPQRRGNLASGRPANPHHLDRDAYAGASQGCDERGRRDARWHATGCATDRRPERSYRPSRCRHRGRAHRRHRAGQVLRAAGDRQWQARGHCEQGAARDARQRNIRGGAQERRDGCVRGGGGRRDSDHQGAARRPDRQSDRMDRRHHQRHQQFHSVGNARYRCDVRRGIEGGPGARLRRSRSHFRRRGYRRCAQAHHHVGDRLRRADAVRQGLHRRHLEAQRARTSGTPRSSVIASSFWASPDAHRPAAATASNCGCIRHWSRTSA